MKNAPINGSGVNFIIAPPSNEPKNIPIPTKRFVYEIQSPLRWGETASYVKFVNAIINAAFAIPDINWGMEIRRRGLLMKIQNNGVMKNNKLAIQSSLVLPNLSENLPASGVNNK